MYHACRQKYAQNVLIIHLTLLDLFEYILNIMDDVSIYVK